MKHCRLVVLTVSFLAGCGAGGGGNFAGTTGYPCGSNEDCASGFCLPFQDGYCSSDCSQDPCAAGEVCKSVQGSQVCLAPCGGPGECRIGYQCYQGVCQPGCVAPADCSQGFACSNGQCEPLPGKAVGEKCAKNEECSSRLCDLASRTCRFACKAEGECGPGETCYLNPVDKNGDSNTDGISPVCIKRRGGKPMLSACAADKDCDQGQCLLGNCVVLCSGACSGPLPLGCATMYAQLDYGAPTVTACLPKTGSITYDLGDQGGGSIGVPSTAQSFSVFVEARNQDLNYYAGVAQLDDPRGNTIYRPARDYRDMPIRYIPSPGTSMMLVSNSPVEAPFRTGLYNLMTFVQTPQGQASPSRTRVRIKLGDGPQKSGHLPLQIFFTNLAGSCAPTLKAGAAKAQLAQFEQQIRTIFAQASLTLDAIEYYDVPSVPSTFYHDGRDDDELANVLKKGTAGGKPDALQVVIVKRITGGQGGNFEVLGVAGGIPASLGIPGTPHSGATVSLSSLCGDPRDRTQRVFSSTVAHELGHTLGLFHNVEQDRSEDNLGDNDGDGERNLMYWVEQSSVNRLTPQQAQVILANPAVAP